MGFLIVAFLYFLPALLAHNKPSFPGILLLNLLLGCVRSAEGVLRGEGWAAILGG